MNMELKNYNNKAQWKIQQMAFMILGVFLFFVLVGLFFLGWQFRDVRSGFDELQREQAISSLRVVADMPELACDIGNSRDSLCVDEDKLLIFRGDLGDDYENFWPVESIEVYKIGENNTNSKYSVYDSGQRNTKKYSTYVSICRKLNEGGYVYDNCEIGKILVGVRIIEEDLNE